MNLDKSTKELLAGLPRAVKAKDVAKGAGVSESWLSRYASGEIAHPSVHNVQALYDFLLAAR